MLQGPRYGALFFHHGESESRRNTEAFQALAQDALKGLTRAVAVAWIGIEDCHGWGSDRAGLQNRAAFPKDIGNGLELILGHCKGRTLHGRDSGPRARIREIQRSGDRHASRAVNLAQEFIIYKDAAI